jgi:hypothetical protein
VCVATRSHRTTVQNQVTPNAVTDIQGQEVDEPTAEEKVDEPVGEQVPVENPPPNIVQAVANEPPTQRESLITPTNPSIGLDNESIATTETGPVVTEVLTQEQREHKYVALEYMSTILDVPLANDLPFARYAKVYDKMPAEDIQRFTYEFHNGKGTFRRLNRIATHLLPTTGPTTHIESPLPLPPLPPIAFTRQPVGTLETPNLSSESDDDSSAPEVRDCYTNFGSKPPNNENDKVLHSTLITLIPSFKRFFEAETKGRVNIDLVNADWKKIRRTYMSWIYPHNLALSTYTETQYSAIYHKLSKTTMSKELPLLKYHVGQTRRAEAFRQWTCSLYYVLQQETLTSRIIDDRGIINYSCNAPRF